MLPRRFRPSPYLRGLRPLELRLEPELLDDDELLRLGDELRDGLLLDDEELRGGLERKLDEELRDELLLDDDELRDGLERKLDAELRDGVLL